MLYLSKHTHKATKDHSKAILHVLMYIVDTVNQGLVLKPNRKWDGSQSHKFIVSVRSDLDFAKEPKDRHLRQSLKTVQL